MKISGIYKIQSVKKPNRCYIGSSMSVGRRWNEHLRDLIANRHHNHKLQNHFNKYGKNDLQFSILIGCDEINMIGSEQFFIDSYNPYFNEIKIAGNQKKPKGQVPWNKGKKNIYTEETLSRMRQSLKGRKVWNKGKNYHFHNKRDNSVYKGRKMSEESKAKISLKARGRKLPIEAIEKIRISKMGNKNMVGRHLSEETKEKIRKSLTGRKQPIEVIEKLRKIKKDWYAVNESRVKGRKLSKEHKKKIFEGLNRHYQKKKLDKFDLITNN